MDIGRLLSHKNLNHVASVCVHFLNQKYGVDVGSRINSIVEAIANDIARSDMIGRITLEDANKLIISQVKDKIISTANASPSASPSASEQVQVEGFRVHSGHNELEGLGGDAVQVQDGIAVTSEDDFYKALQDLETHRNLPPPVGSPSPVKPQQAIQSSHSSQAINLEQGALAAQSPQIVYLPSSMTPKRVSTPVIITGSNRMWEYFTKRSTLVWSGPVPPKAVQVGLSALLLPAFASQQTPIVQVEVTGATGKTIQCICARDGISAKGCGHEYGHGWDTWKPLDDFTELKVLACPWTISLKDLYGQNLELGEDGQAIQNISKLVNGNIKILLNGSRHCIFKESKLIVRNNEKDTHLQIINYDPILNACEASVIDSNNDTFLVSIQKPNALRLLNLHAQATIVLSILS